MASLFVGQCWSQNFLLGGSHLWARFTDEELEAARDCKQINSPASLSQANGRAGI